VKKLLSIPALAAVVFAFTLPSAAQQEGTALPARFSAHAVSLGGPRAPSGTAQVDVTITRWSTPEEREKLKTTLLEQGPDKLLDVLRDLPSVGRIMTPGNVGYDLRYASHRVDGDGTERIFLATDRPISYWEAVARPRISDYPFTFIEMRIGPNGQGEGKLNLATQVNVVGDVVQLVNYDTQPIALNQVRRESR
jgi:hypothetical protein